MTGISSQIPEEASVRPSGLSGFIGQEPLKKKLSVSIESARRRKQAVDHILLSGPPGLGKTTLAMIIAAEMQAKMHYASAPNLRKPGEVVQLMTVLQSGDVLFIDEIHRLSTVCEEVMYSAMEDFFIDFLIESGAAMKSVKLNLEPFTLVGATTRSGMLSPPMKSRFGHHLKLDFYDEKSLKQIVLNAAGACNLLLSEGAASLIASRCRMTPREAIRLVRRVRDYATVKHVREVDEPFALHCLQEMGIDAFGLVELDRKLLRLIIERYSGGPVGIRTLSALVDEEERTIEEEHEPYLLRTGLIEKTPQGRVATELSYSHLGITNR